ncbi:hypothetical protein FB567DRAFT_12528 [Paraphoma chrysanthemicola]|uniref:Tail specific protease domain-containing protein n=1 Tax=Paraphoma chrysanthemicola TaxID=798071 RepID=A0A8K0RJ34_9PLEO|nr:hypothetical protein FB567DRAFT_12528 [Paraphoma chrysanthemicola]
MFKSVLFLASAVLVAAQSEPCAIVASALSRSSSTPIAAQAAFDCLSSVPVNTAGNQALIEELKKVWQFQSELVWLKNPGSDWEYGPLDIIGELDTIKSNLGTFRSEYAVQLAIQNITIRTGNFHFNYLPDILQVFQFRRGFNVASISSDGKALPKLYVHDDIVQLAAGSSRVSEIQQLNGQNPYDYLKSTFFAQYIDSDGQMNNMFSKGDTDHVGAFASQRKFDGNSTDIRWANGSSASVRNLASTEFSFTGVTDGRTFYQKFCTGAITQSRGSADSTDKEVVSVISPSILGPVLTIPHDSYHTRNKRQVLPDSGYPRAVAEDRSGVVAGYFLTGQGYSDVAVLKIISFSNPENSGETAFNNNFQATIKDFLAQCQRQSKTKLIIDLRENGGGNTNLLLDAFMQLFPDLEPFSAQRYRAHPSWLKIGDAVNEIRGNTDMARKYRTATGDNIEQTAIYRYWAYWHFRKADGTNFASWDEFNGPLNLNSDELTVTMRYNYSSADRVSILPTGFNFVNGTRPTVFSASNVVMFTDALCGSSCASFHEELKNIAGVKSVTVGGRPENKPIQPITGSKGGEVVPLVTFPQYAAVLLNISSSVGTQSVKSNDATLTSLASVPQIAVRAGDSSSRAQSQDQIRKGDSTATPLQFIYEAADCRIFYTADSYSDPDLAWKQAWDAFTNDSKCVSGSTAHKSSISGGFKPFGGGQLKAEDQPTSPATGSGSKPSAAANVKGSGPLLALVVGVVAAVLM